MPDWGGMPTHTAASADEDLLPTRPGADEDQANDWRFEIRWTVELAEPKEARQAEDQPVEGPEAGPTAQPDPGEDPAGSFEPVDAATGDGTANLTAVAAENQP